MTTTTTTVDVVMLETPCDYTPAARCPVCGGEYWVKTGRVYVRATKEVSQWKIMSHRVKGAKCTGSGTLVHYSPLVG